MAKYTVNMSCGHTETVELFGKDADRHKKIEYFETYGLCKECFKTQVKEKEESEPFTFHYSVQPFINEKNGEIQFYVWFSGNTKEHMEDIKKLGGYKWCERTAAADTISMRFPGFCWNKVIDRKDVLAEAEKAKQIGVERVSEESDIYSATNYNIAVKKSMLWTENRDRINEIPKPTVPEVLKGHKWNQKIYGKAGNYSIYPDGEKVMISDEQADEIREYLTLPMPKSRGFLAAAEKYRLTSSFLIGRTSS